MIANEDSADPYVMTSVHGASEHGHTLKTSKTLRGTYLGSGVDLLVNGSGQTGRTRYSRITYHVGEVSAWQHV